LTHRKKGIALFAQSGTTSNGGDLTSAFDYLVSALNVRQRLYMGTSSGADEIAESMNHVGMLHFARGNFTLALEFFENALNIKGKEELSGGVTKAQAEYSNNVGMAYFVSVFCLLD
jgi:hypothetical protein